MSFQILRLSFRMCFPWLCLWSWACVLMARHGVDSGGCALILIFFFQRHGLFVVPFVVHVSIWGHVTWKDIWRESHTHHARRSKNFVSGCSS